MNFEQAGGLASLDIAIMVVLLLSALIGLARGLVKEILSLASWMLAFILAIYFAPTVAGHLGSAFGSDSVRLVVAFGAVFIAALIAGGILQWMIS